MKTKQHEKISQLAKNCPQLNAKNPQDCIREPNFGIHKFTELINIKQTGTVGEFIDNFNVCLNSQSHSLSSEQEVALFLNGLKCEVREFVEKGRQRRAELEESIKLAYLFERSYGIELTESYSGCYFCGKTDHRAMHCNINKF